MAAEAEISYSSRGVITKIFGFIIMSLGVLDSLLSLRGGVPAYEFLLLIVFGAVVFAIGAVRGGWPAPDEREAQAGSGEA